MDQFLNGTIFKLNKFETEQFWIWTNLKLNNFKYEQFLKMNNFFGNLNKILKSEKKIKYQNVICNKIEAEKRESPN
jgi:hypothetical protein